MGSSVVRIAPASWSRPDLQDWVAAIQAAYEIASRRDSQVALVAHSLGCWAAAHWLEQARPDTVVAFLVAPPNPQGPAFPREAASTFLGLSARPLPCPSLMVASDDDPIATRRRPPPSRASGRRKATSSEAAATSTQTAISVTGRRGCNSFAGSSTAEMTDPTRWPSASTPACPHPAQKARAWRIAMLRCLLKGGDV